jgi:hypothetical protein
MVLTAEVCNTVYRCSRHGVVAARQHRSFSRIIHCSVGIMSTAAVSLDVVAKDGKALGDARAVLPVTRLSLYLRASNYPVIWSLLYGGTVESLFPLPSLIT